MPSFKDVDWEAMIFNRNTNCSVSIGIYFLSYLFNDVVTGPYRINDGIIIWMWSVWLNENWQVRRKYIEETGPGANLSTKNLTWPDLGSNQRDEPPELWHNPSNQDNICGCPWNSKFNDWVTYGKLRNIVICIPIPRQRVGKHITATHAHATMGSLLLCNEL
jgi:hypothetical protein